MQKSKSWLKSLLIVVLAIVLVFTLVACNKDKDSDNKNKNDNNNDAVTFVKESSADYFNALWNATKSLGSTAIAKDKDIAVSFGFELSLDTWDVKAERVYQQIDLGFDVHAVIARSKATAGNTAIKVRLYDPTDANHQEILTLYAFANDLDNFYIDFAGKNIKLPHNLESLILKDVLDMEDTTAGGELVKFLTEHKFKIGGQDKTVNDIIDAFASQFGPNWSINTLVKGILNVVNWDADKIFDFIRDPNSDGDSVDSLEGIITQFFGGNSLEEALLDNNGDLDILRILTVEMLNDMLPAAKATAGTSTIHKLNLSTVVGMVVGMALGDDNDIMKELFNEYNAAGKVSQTGEISLSFTEKGGKIEDLAVYAQLLGMKKKVSDGGTERTVFPEISLKITEFGIEALAADKSNGVALKKGVTYSDTIAFDETLELAASGIKVLALEQDGNDISLNGKIVVNVKGQLDIVNTNAVINEKDDDDITENKTKANITVQLYNRNDPVKTIAQLSYANGKIVGKLGEGIDLGSINKEWAGKTGIVYELADDFNIADIVQNAVAKFVNGIANKGKNNNATTSAASDVAPQLSLVEKIKNAVFVALNMLTTPDNHLHIVTNNILQTVVNFKEAIVPGAGTTSNPGKGKWTEKNRIEAIVNTLINPPLDKNFGECVDIIAEQIEIFKDADLEAIYDACYEMIQNPPKDKTQEECFEILKGQLEEIIGGDVDLEAVFNTCKDAALTALYNIALNVRIEGVAVSNQAGAYDAFKQGGAAITDETIKLYIENIKAVLGAQIVIDGDLQDGIHASISIKIADATLSVSTSFELVEVDAETFYNLYEDYTADLEDSEHPEKAEKWYIFE